MLAEDILREFAPLFQLTKAMERIATCLEQDMKHKYGPYDGSIRKVTPEQWRTLTPYERAWSRTDG